MATRTLITIGTDGLADWVRTPDGSKHNLGSVSVLSLVHKLSRDTRHAKAALDAFLRDGEAMIQVSEDQLWELLAPKRARWASDGSFIDHDQGTGLPRRNMTMTPFDRDLDVLEQHIAAMNKAAGHVSPAKMAEGVAILQRLAHRLQAPVQTKNASYLGFEAPAPEQQAAPFEVADDPASSPVGVTATEVPGLSYNLYEQNTGLATRILDRAEAVNAKIDTLMTAGKKFNASRAKADIYAVTSKVAGILRDVDLTTPWVQDDLKKLAARAEELHALFATAKV
jgi:hypothetical protein